MRIDVPLRTSFAYLFVDPSQEEWDPWWRLLYEYLLDRSRESLHWQREPVQGIFFARPELSHHERAALVEFLKGAPPAQVAHHRTLRRAVNLSQDQAERLAVMYFSGDEK